MASPLDAIKKPIETELKQFESHFRDSVRSNVSLLDRITYYIVQRKGKQVRPMFVFLAAKLCGEIKESTYTAASFVELLHSASLVHDDVVDESYKRRGFFSVNALWKNKIAVLVGDYFLSRGMLLALQKNEFKLLEIVTEAVQAMIEGELLQLEKARRLDIKEEVYYEIIRSKTASLIAAACAVGASSVVDDPEKIRQMHAFGEKIGIAFQIRDDLFDFGDEQIGKPLGIDIKEKKMTLPLIYALTKAPKTERRRILNLIRRHNKDRQKVAEVIAFVRASGGIEYAREVMYRYREEAFVILKTFPDCAARTSLKELVIFVTERKK
ncbi:MAG: polyprenyl synthetase family protein [Saprospiraceae bacterium]|nr:polyprenyl synthetase family protein [Saprospiraceae bacterium]